jgi:hypothetical protein
MTGASAAYTKSTALCPINTGAILIDIAIFSCSLSNKLFIGIKGYIFFITFVGQN